MSVYHCEVCKVLCTCQVCDRCWVADQDEHDEAERLAGVEQERLLLSESDARFLGFQLAE